MRQAAALEVLGQPLDAEAIELVLGCARLEERVQSETADPAGQVRLLKREYAFELVEDPENRAKIGALERTLRDRGIEARELRRRLALGVPITPSPKRVPELPRHGGAGGEAPGPGSERPAGFELGQQAQQAQEAGELRTLRTEVAELRRLAEDGLVAARAPTPQEKTLTEILERQTAILEKTATSGEKRTSTISVEPKSPLAEIRR